MANIRLILEYNGAGFHGWQVQPGMRTVESELKRVLQIVLREEIGTLYASSRTDSGVHARGQVVNFHIPREPDLRRLMNSVSHLLKNELSVVSASVVPDGFHSRKNALRKRYVYTMLHRDAPPVLEYGRVWHISSALDIERMRREAQALIGTHDFSSLRDSDCNARSPVKTIESIQIEDVGTTITISVIGSGFLKHMVRNIVGTLVEFGRGVARVNSMHELLQLKDRRRAGATAPAHGLCLDWVEYPAAALTRSE